MRERGHLTKNNRFESAAFGLNSKLFCGVYSHNVWKRPSGCLQFQILSICLNIVRSIFASEPVTLDFIPTRAVSIWFRCLFAMNFDLILPISLSLSLFSAKHSTYAVWCAKGVWPGDYLVHLAVSRMDANLKLASDYRCLSTSRLSRELQVTTLLGQPLISKFFWLCMHRLRLTGRNCFVTSSSCILQPNFRFP